MANGDRFFGEQSCQGDVTATGANIFVQLDFNPSSVTLWNTTSEVLMYWVNSMPAASGYKLLGSGSGTVGNTTATNAASAVTGTGTFLGTAPTSSLNLATPAFSGTGLTAAGQVITTTDNQTMSANQCAGMWLISATGATPPNLILSNTAVTGAAAVLTVQGAASTDAGAYKIVKALTPVGSVSALSGTAAAQVQVAHTHPFSGSAGGTAFVVVGGISPGSSGFQIGTDADLNNNGDTIKWIAFRQ